MIAVNGREEEVVPSVLAVAERRRRGVVAVDEEEGDAGVEEKEEEEDFRSKSSFSSRPMLPLLCTMVELARCPKQARSILVWK